MEIIGFFMGEIEPTDGGCGSNGKIFSEASAGLFFAIKERPDGSELGVVGTGG